MSHSVTIRKVVQSILLLLVLIPALEAGSTYNYFNGALDKERFSKLNLFERTQYRKAYDLFQNNQYSAAAAEFEKFKVQFDNSPILAYVIFMRGFSLHHARDRNLAIKIYNEVLDYFGEEIADASAALYFIGVANYENGDNRKGLEAFTEMIEDADYSKNFLAAGAFNYVAENNWKNQKFEEAVRIWKEVCEKSTTENRQEANKASDSITNYYCMNGKFMDFEKWYTPVEFQVLDPKMKTPADGKDFNYYQRLTANAVYNNCLQGFANNRWGKYTNFNQKQKEQDARAFWNFYTSKLPAYKSPTELWAYHSQLIYISTFIDFDKKVQEKALEDIILFIKGIKEPEDRDNKYEWLIDRLRQAQQTERAQYTISKMENRVLATWKEYQILGEDQRKWDEAVKKLLILEASGDENWAARALATRAHVYQYYMRKYKEAIELYLKINKPPETLFRIAECHSGMGNLKEALSQLQEIENMFPPVAPRAAFCMAQLYKDAGESKSAVSTCTRILRAYKGSQASSQAHQMLEGYGIDTGGGMVTEDDE
ncbi:MAG: hypothetical protein HQL31_01010 [Planctomycetes bacterium]|nr:hypothetical protein [Planctomycetota bacterium]